MMWESTAGVSSRVEGKFAVFEGRYSVQVFEVGGGERDFFFCVVGLG